MGFELGEPRDGGAIIWGGQLIIAELFIYNYVLLKFR